ncbi:MAG: porin [Gemmataceae bacterium]|nr:porin [Gemmataceae bacterium]
MVQFRIRMIVWLSIASAFFVFPAWVNAQPPAFMPMLPGAGNPLGSPQAKDSDQAPTSAAASFQGLDRKEIEEIIGVYWKKKEDEKKRADAAKKEADEEKKLIDAAVKKEEARANDHGVQFKEHRIFPRAYEQDPEQEFALQSLLDSLSRNKEGKKWYDRLSIRGYTQIRFGRTLTEEAGSAPANLFGDRTINGQRENFLIRRARLVLSGDVSDHLFVYFQPDFASNTDGANNNTFYAQLRDLYADYYIDKEKVNRLRIGLSKIPYGWENCQSSQNRITLDRTDAMNSAVAPNERDLGVIYYWTPVEKQKLLSMLVNGGLKGSNNFGIFAFGVYNGQGGSQIERDNNLHIVSRLTCPVQLPNGQVIEAGIQGYRGMYSVGTTAIRPLGKGAAAVTPSLDGGTTGIFEQRAAASFTIFPQPWGFQAEWQYGEGPGLNDAQTQIGTRNLHGGYLMTMYRHETDKWGIQTPYVRWQQYTGGYKSQINAPYGHQRQLDVGVEWQLRKEFEITFEYSKVQTPNFTALTGANQVSYQDFRGDVFRVQMQFNY